MLNSGGVKCGAEKNKEIFAGLEDHAQYLGEKNEAEEVNSWKLENASECG